MKDYSSCKPTYRVACARMAPSCSWHHGRRAAACRQLPEELTDRDLGSHIGLSLPAGVPVGPGCSTASQRAIMSLTLQERVERERMLSEQRRLSPAVSLPPRISVSSSSLELSSSNMALFREAIDGRGESIHLRMELARSRATACS